MLETPSWTYTHCAGARHSASRSSSSSFRVRPSTSRSHLAPVRGFARAPHPPPVCCGLDRYFRYFRQVASKRRERGRFVVTSVLAASFLMIFTDSHTSGATAAAEKPSLLFAGYEPSPTAVTTSLHERPDELSLPPALDAMASFALVDMSPKVRPLNTLHYHATHSSCLPDYIHAHPHPHLRLKPQPLSLSASHPHPSPSPACEPAAKAEQAGAQPTAGQGRPQVPRRRRAHHPASDQPRTQRCGGLGPESRRARRPEGSAFRGGGGVRPHAELQEQHARGRDAGLGRPRLRPEESEGTEVVAVTLSSIALVVVVVVVGLFIIMERLTSSAIRLLEPQRPWCLLAVCCLLDA